MDNITLIAIGIIALWMVAIAFYLFVFRQQERLNRDVEELQAQLDQSSEEEE